MPNFEAFPKIPRLNRNMVITEKIDGTNAAIGITDEGIYAQSRRRIITPEDDNAGFARWVQANKEQIIELLGPGLHFGEWWGSGIQRGYDMDEKYFSLFNTSRWAHTFESDRNSIEGLNMRTVPLLMQWTFDNAIIDSMIENLKSNGSAAAPGYMNPEGVVVFLPAANSMFKVTCTHDEISKGEAEARAKELV